jgi:hypothetical protein
MSSLMEIGERFESHRIGRSKFMALAAGTLFGATTEVVFADKARAGGCNPCVYLSPCTGEGLCDCCVAGPGCCSCTGTTSAWCGTGTPCWTECADHHTWRCCDFTQDHEPDNPCICRFFIGDPC